jgi:hypothetical protein
VSTLSDIQRKIELVSVYGGMLNPILHTVWLDSHALTLKNYTAKYYEVRKIWFFAYLTNFLSSIEENCSHVYIIFYCYNMSVFCKHSLNVWQISHHLS